jgi:hypothetical protein
MKKIILLAIIWSMVLTANAQQIGNGYTVGIPNFNAPLLSGAYHTATLQPNFPAAQEGMATYLLTERSIADKNFQMQIASSMYPDNRLFFRKLAMQDLSNAPNSVGWHEVATRSSNKFTDHQYIPTNKLLYFGDASELTKRTRIFCNSYGHFYFDFSSRFVLRNTNNDHPIADFKVNGDFYFGTPDFPADKVRLFVNGNIFANEIQIKSNVWADFVFNDDYRLKPLSEVNAFIKENKHLPEIPSATEIQEKEGVNVGEMQVKLLQKIEELTLYLIQQNEKIQVLESELNELKNK